MLAAFAVLRRPRCAHPHRAPVRRGRTGRRGRPGGRRCRLAGGDGGPPASLDRAHRGHVAGASWRCPGPPSSASRSCSMAPPPSCGCSCSPGCSRAPARRPCSSGWLPPPRTWRRTIAAARRLPTSRCALRRPGRRTADRRVAGHARLRRCGCARGLLLLCRDHQPVDPSGAHGGGGAPPQLPAAGRVVAGSDPVPRARPFRRVLVVRAAVRRGPGPGKRGRRVPACTPGWSSSSGSSGPPPDRLGWRVGSTIALCGVGLGVGLVAVWASVPSIWLAAIPLGIGMSLPVPVAVHRRHRCGARERAGATRSARSRCSSTCRAGSARPSSVSRCR